MTVFRFPTSQKADILRRCYYHNTRNEQFQRFVVIFIMIHKSCLEFLYNIILYFL